MAARTAVGVVAVALLGGAGVAALRPPDVATPAGPPAPVASAPALAGSPRAVAALQDRLRRTPGDAAGWAALGLQYVAQAGATADPTWYSKAEGAFARSLQIDDRTNDAAMAGRSALASAQHDFRAARTWARRGIAVNPSSATLHGALADAETQLGRYAQAEAATQRMLDLEPGLPAYTRAEYALELRGDVAGARAALDRALSEAREPADVAFVRRTGADLAFSTGDYAAALREADAGLAADASYAGCLAARARALAALGRTDEALADYDRLVARAPEPSYVLEHGRLLESLGRRVEAERAYALFEAENQLFQAAGVALDTDATLFAAERGDVAAALEVGRAGLRARPFVEMEDAWAWALHAAGRNEEALVQARRAARLGTKNALFAYHRGMIEKSLGQRDAAVRSLRQALRLSPAFDPLAAPRARAALAELGGSA